jgi:hypothetical protein
VIRIHLRTRSEVRGAGNPAALLRLRQRRERVKRYSSFVVRRWQLELDSERVQVEHMQSGKRTVVDSLTTAARWMESMMPSAERGDSHEADKEVDRLEDEQRPQDPTTHIK